LQRPFGSKYQLDWQLIVVAPEQDFTLQVTQARQWALLAMAALIGVGVIVAYAVAQGLSRQFQHLNRSATLVGTGQVPAVQQNAAFREVHLLSEVMHDSAVQLRDYNQEIQQKNTALQEAAQMLEERVRQRTAELAASREEALAAVKAKAGFLAVMSHEIRTPLNGVVGMSELLEDTGLTNEQKDLLGVLRVSSEQLLAVVDDILDFSKIESGKLALEHLPLDLRGTIAGVCDIVRFRSQEKGLPLKVHIAPDVPPAITGDITRLRQVLLNLLSNAIKFTDHGEVTLRVWVERKGHPMVLGFSVSDTGVGISAHRLGDLFQPFSQGDTSTARVYGGTGLGLMICRHLVELMGGEIMVSSQVGVGSTFRFTARATAADPQDVVPLRSSAPASTRHLQRVLVVDDNPVNLKVASAMLTRLGYPHDTLDNGLRAIEAVEQAQRELRPYALLLLDSHMPDIDGVSTAKQIRARLGAQAPVIIGVSASSLVQDRVRCLEAGMADYLVKPMELQVLGQVLQRWAGDQSGAAEDAAAAHPDSARWIDPSRLASMAEFDDAQGSLRRGIVDDFLATLDDRVGAVSRAAQAQDFGSLFTAAHLLNGACANVGATALSELCAAVEQAASENTLSEAGMASLLAAAVATRRSLEDTARRIGV
jgi:signal transduction histidine kinase/response regulator of citrate/malate metabolism